MDLYYTDIGIGFPIVFVHAFPLDGRMWESEARAATAAGFRAIVLDLPGFGQSPIHPDTSSMDFFASEIAETLDEEGIDKAVFCGLSMGGYALFELFRQRPAVFAGLVLCDTTAEADTDQKRAGRAAMIDLVETEGTKALVGDLLPKLLSPSTMEKNKGLVERLSEIIEEQSGAAVCAALRGMAERTDSKELLSNMDFPVKLIFGSEDAVTGQDAARDLEAGIPGAELSFINSAGHYSNLEDPKEFNNELMSYLTSLPLTH